MGKLINFIQMAKDISNFLADIKLEQYFSIFEETVNDDVEELETLADDELNIFASRALR